MRYIPETDCATTIEEIAAQCAAAIKPESAQPPGWVELRRIHLENYHSGGTINRHWLQFLDLCVALDVARAMGDHDRARLLQRQIIEW